MLLRLASQWILGIVVSLIQGIPFLGLRENLTRFPEASGAPRWERTSGDAERETL